jgi:hypothetical protein
LMTTFDDVKSKRSELSAKEVAARAGASGEGTGVVPDLAGRVTEAMNKDGAGDGLERGNDRASRSRQEPGSA